MGVVPRTKREREVLEACNEIREALGRMKKEHLEKGLLGKASKCPIANTIGEPAFCQGSVVVILDHFDKDNDVVFDRPVFSDFVEDFDNGRLPHLVQA